MSAVPSVGFIVCEWGYALLCEWGHALLLGSEHMQDSLCRTHNVMPLSTAAAAASGSSLKCSMHATSHLRRTKEYKVYSTQPPNPASIGATHACAARIPPDSASTRHQPPSCLQAPACRHPGGGPCPTRRLAHRSGRRRMIPPPASSQSQVRSCQTPKGAGACAPRVQLLVLPCGAVHASTHGVALQLCTCIYGGLPLLCLPSSGT